jgi:hypothetical protein
LGHDNNVDKLITICTPHWGSGYAEVSCISGAFHKLCDHDLRFGSAMYGGDFSTTLNCNALANLNVCTYDSYTLRDELNYSKNKNTKYYAIAGIDYMHNEIRDNDYCFEMPTNFNTYGDIQYYLKSKSLYGKDSEDYDREVLFDVNVFGDNMVGFLSQIGWTEGYDIRPAKKINMEKIFLDFDTNGGNGQNMPIVEALNMLHNKIPHRMCVMEKIYEYLNE